MNWLDFIIILILTIYMIKGFSFGLLLSILRISTLILSLIFTDRLYPIVYGYVVKNPSFNEVFEDLTGFISNLLFSEGGQGLNFIPRLISGKLSETITLFLLIAIIFLLINSILRLIVRRISFNINIPILKQLDKLGGIGFGLLEGLFIIFFIGLALLPIGLLFPESVIGSGVNTSLILDYISYTFNILLDLKLNKIPTNFI